MMSLTDIVRKAIFGISVLSAISISNCEDGKIRATYDYNKDGKPDKVLTWYDAKRHKTREDVDLGEDGKEIHEYDNKGNRIRRTDYDSGSIKPNLIITFEYDSKGNVIKEMRDSDCDGKPDMMITREYDSKGNKVKGIVDFNCDGKPDEIWMYKYDSKGNRIEDIWDGNCDGKPDRVYKN